MFKELADAFCSSIIDLSEPDQTKVKQVSDEIEQTILRAGNLDKKEENPIKSTNNQEYTISIKTF